MVMKLKKYFNWFDGIVEELANKIVRNNTIHDVAPPESPVLKELERLSRKIEYEQEIKRHQWEIVNAILKTSDTMLWAKNCSGRYCYSSRLMCNRLYDKQACDLFGKSDDELAEYNLSNTLSHVCQATDRIVLNSNKPTRFIEIVKKHGYDIWLDVKKTPFVCNGLLKNCCELFGVLDKVCKTDCEGCEKVCGICLVGMAFDVTEYKSMYEKLLSQGLEQGTIKEIVDGAYEVLEKTFPNGG